jgi:hypothetical protein
VLLHCQRVTLGGVTKEHRHVQQIHSDCGHDGHRYRQELGPRASARSAILYSFDVPELNGEDLWARPPSGAKKSGSGCSRQGAKSRPVPLLYWRSAIGERPYPLIVRFTPSSWPLGCRDLRGPSRRPFPGLGSIDHRGGRCRNTKDVELINLTAEPPPVTTGYRISAASRAMQIVHR